MSIVKDLLLIVLFIVMILKYRSLYKEMIAQREYFIKTLSHDLRVSTLAQIRGIEFLSKTMKNELVDNIYSSCKYSLDMVNMLLNTYRFENGEQILNYEFFNYSDLILETCNRQSLVADEKFINFKYDLCQQDVIDADKEFVSKVVKELLLTSIYYADKNSTLSISLKKLENNYETTIVYRGKSLSDEECRRMFCKNPRFSTVGHGIKMHLCKKIVEFHGGEIKVYNCADNINAFKFTIPAEKKEIYYKAPCIGVLQTFN